MGYGDRVGIDKMIGKTVIKAIKSNVEINFICSDGTTFKMFHDQDCCEGVSIEDITGDLEDLYGSPILAATEDTNSETHPEGKPSPEYGYDSFTYTFYTLRNINATVQIRWFGESNGYYSESVSIEMTAPEQAQENQVH